MKTIETTVYTFEELKSEEAKDKARQWYTEGLSYDDSQIAYDDTVEDAKRVLLRIETLSDRRANKGQFYEDAESCAKAIMEEHGQGCETYNTAKRFLMSIDSLNDEYGGNPEGSSDIDGRNNYETEKEELEREFLHNILEDYRVYYEKDIEYRQSNEYVDENIIANEYTFTESGKRFG